VAILNSLKKTKAWLEHCLIECQQQIALLEASSESHSPSPEVSEDGNEVHRIAWGSQVSPMFKERVLWIADNLGCSPSDLMACMAWESAETFRADIKNAAGSGATGLIQFMPKTAKGLGTSTAALAKMTPEDQLNYVYKYFQPYAGRLHNLGDVYMAILWPKGVEKPDHYVLFDKKKMPKTFRQNAGLDVNKDGLVTRAECLVKVNEKLAKGLQPHNVG
jgi:hypothetical protein